ncbi:hypothetical protein ACHAPF_011053 [Botrytis cinerea]
MRQLLSLRQTCTPGKRKQNIKALAALAFLLALETKVVDADKIACEQFINDPTSPKAIGLDSQAQGDSNRIYNELGLLKVEFKLKVGKWRKRIGAKVMGRKRRKCGSERSRASGGGVVRSEFGGKSLSNRIGFLGSNGEEGEESDGGKNCDGGECGSQDDLWSESSENDSDAEGEGRVRKPRDKSWKGIRKAVGGKGPMKSPITLEVGQESVGQGDSFRLRYRNFLLGRKHWDY